MQAGDLVKSRLCTAIGYIAREHTFWGGDSVWVYWISGGEHGTWEGYPKRETMCYKENLQVIST